MRVYIDPHDYDGLPVQVLVSADEAERWIADLRSAVRGVREGQGDQLLLLGEPARAVVTVQERLPAEPTERYEMDERMPDPQPDLPRLLGPAGLPIVLAIFVTGFFLALAIKFLP